MKDEMMATQTRKLWTGVAKRPLRVKAGDQTFDDLRMAVQEELEELISGSSVPGMARPSSVWVVDMTDTWVVFQVDGEMYRSDYSVDGAGSVSFGPPSEVQRRTTYVPVAPDAADTGMTEAAAKKAPPKAMPMAPKDGPHGKVSYADPGYQKDGKPRYPIDTAEHVRAAWAYINVPGNAALCTPGQVARMKARILAAAKRLGVDIAKEKAELEARLRAVYQLPQLPESESAASTPVESVAPVESVGAPAELVVSETATIRPAAGSHGLYYTTPAGGITYTTSTATNTLTPVAPSAVPVGEVARPFLTEVAGRTLITGPAEVSKPLDPQFANEHFMMLQGRFVGAEAPNRNGALWTTKDLELGQFSVPNGPLNWLHDARHVIGSITKGQLVTRNEQADADYDLPFIAATSAVWKWIYPDEASVLEMASDQGKLWYSMECVSKNVQCVGDGGCGVVVAYADYVGGTEKACGHMRERSATRRFAEPTFLGGAVIVPPVRPGWVEADVRVLRESASLVESAFDQAGRPDISAAEWEQLMAGVLSYASA